MTQEAVQSPDRLTPFILVACTWVSVLSTDLYAPSLPHLATLLASDDATVQLTMSLNLAAYAIAQLFHGPLAEYFGRKKLLLTGIIGFAVASAFCALATTIELLVTGRVLQGLMSSVPSVVVVLLIRELYSKGRAVQILGFHGMAVGVAPIIGPLIGGYVFVLLGWRANFWLLVLVSTMTALVLAARLPDSPVARRPVHPAAIARQYLLLLRRRAYLHRLIPLAMVFGALFAFVTNGPFVLIEQFGVATERYGIYFGIVVLGAIAGGFMANRLAGSVPTDKLATWAIVFAAAGSLALSVSAMSGIETMVALIGGMTVFALGLGLLNATGPILLLDGVSDLPQGPAAALLGSLQLAAASMASFLVGTFYDGSSTPMAATITAFVLTGLAAHIILSDKAG